MANKEHPFILDFASRYETATQSFLNAYIAITRLEELLEDAKSFRDRLTVAVPIEERWFPWVGSEMFSYYAVGFVTCLEWHARSRLVDLLTYRPAVATDDDLRVIRDKFVIPMLKANLTVASLVGATTHVSSFKDYMNIFSRIFNEFGQGPSAFDHLKANQVGTSEPWVRGQEISDLNLLYAFRHNLVHEIGIERVGHINVRDGWDSSRAIEQGELVLRTMRAMESALTKSMPYDFPNLLDGQFHPVSQSERLAKEIPVLEAELERRIALVDQDNKSLRRRRRKVNEAALNYIDKERNFISECPALYNRYIEMREPLRLALVKTRLTYLKAVIDMVGDVWMVQGPEPTGDADPPA